MTDKSHFTTENVHHTPIIGDPANEDIARAIGDEGYRKELCEQYGPEKIDQLINHMISTMD
ncbi:hypothetical protein [Photobacterium sp. OFAV2-7]|uniref:hypothetical protein n=1 Tax=Photobacterium sp. OFAV2-7 TaxID=2917748 RepID=UPI001EF5F26F|nr:hypothetical protein [Photobacterium sp. OFAV2-7]MCG7587165.1 hypothetical protein [Photobacterium sp. OFAV2-7]